LLGFFGLKKVKPADIRGDASYKAGEFIGAVSLRYLLKFNIVT
jgi:hypothetical protein